MLNHEGKVTAEPTLVSLSMQIGILQSEMTGVRESLKQMTEAITKLAVIEERMVSTAVQQDRILGILRDNRTELLGVTRDLSERIKDIEGRVDNLEKSMPMKELIQNWVLSGAWVVIGVVALFIAKKVGLL